MKNPVWPSFCVAPAGASNKLDVQNEWEENIFVGVNDSTTVSSAWELTSVSMHYSQGNEVHTPLSRVVLYPRSVCVYRCLDKCSIGLPTARLCAV